MPVLDGSRAHWLGCMSLAASFAACSASPVPTTASPAGGAAGMTPVAMGGTGGSGEVVVKGGAANPDNGGAAGLGGAVTVGGSGGGAATDFITEPEGQLPNTTQPDTMVNLPREEWPKGLILAESLEVGHHQNQPIVVNGYLGGSGNAEFVWYDIKDPTKPVLLSRIGSPGHDPTAGPKKEGEAESHQVSVARYGNKFYEVTTSGLGVDIWDITDARAMRHIKLVPLEGITYGDFTDAVWGIYWQGDTIYVGGTSTGLHILDASDPENVTFVKKLPTSAFGGVSAGPLFAVGNVLVITTPKDSGGIATMDISDPHNPLLLDSIKPAKSYIGGMYGRYAYLQGPVRAWDVLSDPLDIGLTPDGTLNTDASEYVSFSDGYLFLGHLRPNAGVSKIDVTDVTKMSIESRVWGRLEFTNGDDQFTLAIGSLIVMADDELPYRGMTIGVHSTKPDTTPPIVDSVVPKDGAKAQSVKSRIGFSFTDNIELATVHPGSLIVRPTGGEPISGKWGLYMGILNFDPDEELLPATTYEVELPAGGVKDLVGNGIAAAFKSTFTTK